MSDLFPQHPRSGDWETLKGKALSPHELSYDVQDQNFGDSRLNQTTPNDGWASHILVTTGTTGAGGTLAK